MQIYLCDIELITSELVLIIHSSISQTVGRDPEEGHEDLSSGSP